MTSPTLLGYASFGFGETTPELKLRDLIPERRDRKAATPTDLFLMAAVRELRHRIEGLVTDPERAAVYVASSKHIASDLIEGVDESFFIASGDGLVEKLSDRINPFFCLSGLPNIGSYLLVKYFDLRGTSNHFTCDPWADVVVFEAAIDIVASGEADIAVAAAACSTAQVETAAVFGESALREVPQPSVNEGGVALLVGGQPGDGSPIRRPLITVGGTATKRIEKLSRWLGAETTNRAIWLRSHDGDDPPGFTGISWDVRSVPDRSIPFTSSLVEEIEGTRPLVLAVDYGDALTALSVG